MNAPLRIVLVGASGRMGKAVIGLAENDPRFAIAAKVGRADSLEKSSSDADVVIDFSLASATKSVSEICARLKRPLVLGTTGQNEIEQQAVRAAAREIPVVFSANFGVGVNVLFQLAREAANSLGQDFDVEIIEAHHRTKKDAPSGTAKHLADVVQSSLGAARDLPVHSIRAGDVVGDHTIIFAGQGERLELTHRASSREIFARGALRAARWVIDQPPGLYRMEDMLGFARGE
ncbi:MAG TPA: 4-hydroxy-tetrahydrodipicolinate reductase [Chthoniobacterales bacterium]|jgi:4-hydroxy-tetrahydrodipicolinate reductase